MPDYLLQESGSRFSLEDLSGFIILETSTPGAAGAPRGIYAFLQMEGDVSAELDVYGAVRSELVLAGNVHGLGGGR